MITTDHSKIKVFNIIMILALAFALVAGAIAVKEVTTVTTASAAANIPPKAEAGADQAVQSVNATVHTGGFPRVILDGSRSFDVDGTIYAYVWEQYDHLPTMIPEWQSNTPYTAVSATTAASVVIPTNDNLRMYVCTVAGTSGGIEPSWPTVTGNTIVDGGVTWTCAGPYTDYTPANDWPAIVKTGATITEDGTIADVVSTPGAQVSATTTGLYVFRLVVSDGTYFGVDFVVVVFGQTWFVDLGGSDGSGTGLPASPWRTITFAINNPLVKHGDRIIVGPNNSAGTQPAPHYALAGFGGNTADSNEQIVIDKWLTVWSKNGRDDQTGANATTINVSSQNSATGLFPVQQVVSITWPFGPIDPTTTDGLNAEKCGVVFGCNFHGFNLIGAPIGILAEGANAVYIHQNRIEENTFVYSLSPDTNFWGILLNNCKAPTVDDNIVNYDGEDAAGASYIGIELVDCDETLPNLVWYNVIYGTTAVGTLNVKGGAQVIHNVVTVAQYNNVEGIILTNCPKAWVFDNEVSLTVKRSVDAYSIGIGLFGTDEDACDWSVVEFNDVTVNVTGEISAVGKGIVVEDCDYVKVNDNTVLVVATGESTFAMGGLLGIGISMVAAPGSQVLRNTVDVNNEVSGLDEDGEFVQVANDDTGIQDLSDLELADLQAALNDIFSDNFAPTVKYAASLAMGIYAYGSTAIRIGSTDPQAFTGNTIDVCSHVVLLAANFEDDEVAGTDPVETLKCAGSSLAQGITVLECDGAVVATNLIVPAQADAPADGTWAPTTAYGLWDVVQMTALDDNITDYNFYYQCTVAGTSGATEPTWPGVKGATVVDGTLTWTCVSGSADQDGDTVGVHAYLLFSVYDKVPSKPTPTPEEALPEGTGKSGAIGILVFACQPFAPNPRAYPTMVNGTPVMVLYNTLCVLGDADLELMGAEVEILTDFSDSVLGQLDAAMEDMVLSIGAVAASPDVNLQDLAVAPFGGPGVGITQFDPDAFAKAKGLVFGIGIATMRSAAAVIVGNTIDSADADLDGEVVALTGVVQVLPLGEEDAVVATSLHNLCLAIGILNYLCGMTYPGYDPIPTTISNNFSKANADSNIYVESAQIVANGDGGDAEAHGTGSSAGIGILVIGLEGMWDQSTIALHHNHGFDFEAPSDAIVTYNSASGNGIICLTTVGYNLVDELLAEADAYAIGMGGGIVVIGQMFPLIDHNGDISGEYEPGDILDPEMNFVSGYGEACAYINAVGLSAEDPEAEGAAMSVGVGIGAFGCLDPQISYNMNFHKQTYTPQNALSGSEATPYNPETEFYVTGEALAVGYVDGYNQAILVGSQETLADGFSYAAGFGILIASCEGAYVTHNHAQGLSDATVMVLAVDEDPLEYVEAVAYGLSLACGISVTDVMLMAQDTELHMPYCITESNTFEAGAIISIPACEAIGDPLAIAMGFAAGIDAFIAIANDFNGTEDYFGIQPLVYNYNDMPGLVLSAAYDGHAYLEAPWTFWVDFGMLVINLNSSFINLDADDDVDLLLVDARYNYWGDPENPIDYNDPTTFNLTGPGGIGFGVGQPIYVFRQPWTTFVCYQPWLVINHEWCLDAHVGKFGKVIVLDKCWNTFSVPIELDDIPFVGVKYTADDPSTTGIDETLLDVSYSTWAGFKLLNQLDEVIGPAIRWDTVNQVWVNLTQWQSLDPLMGFKIYVKTCVPVFILASTSDSMPTLPVFDGWNLVGPNPPFCDPGMHVGDFVSSVARTGGVGLEFGSFSQVVSQGSSQHNWSYTLGDWISLEDGPFMQVGKGYWMYMNGGATLAGFGFTRLPLYPEHFH